MSFLEHQERFFSVATDDLFTSLTSACTITELLMKCLDHIPLSVNVAKTLLRGIPHSIDTSHQPSDG